jgi:hypothetical protein
MKVVVKGEKVDFEAEGDTHVDVFRKLAEMTEVFADEPCGICKGVSYFRVRKVPDPKKPTKTYEYFERVCA